MILQVFFLYLFNVLQYARIVREALCELELPYILHNVGEGSSNSELLLKASSSKEVILQKLLTTAKYTKIPINYVNEVGGTFVLPFLSKEKEKS